MATSGIWWKGRDHQSYNAINIRRKILRGWCKVIIGGYIFYFYQMHYAKMLYLLTQHTPSMWLYYCEREIEITKNKSHVCIAISETNQLKYYNTFFSHWIENNGSNYSDSHHRKWIGVWNKVISQLGIHPKLLPRNMIHFDFFDLSNLCWPSSW